MKCNNNFHNLEKIAQKLSSKRASHKFWLNFEFESQTESLGNEEFYNFLIVYFENYSSLIMNFFISFVFYNHNIKSQVKRPQQVVIVFSLSFSLLALYHSDLFGSLSLSLSLSHFLSQFVSI